MVREFEFTEALQVSILSEVSPVNLVLTGAPPLNTCILAPDEAAIWGGRRWSWRTRTKYVG